MIFCKNSKSTGQKNNLLPLKILWPGFTVRNQIHIERILVANHISRTGRIRKILGLDGTDPSGDILEPQYVKRLGLM